MSDSRSNLVRLVALYLFIVAIILFNGWFLHRNFTAVSDQQKWVEHTHQVISEFDLVLSSVKDAETGARGYRLTGKEEYLEPFRKGVIEMRQHMLRAGALVQDNPQQVVAVAALKPLIEKRVEILEGTIAQYVKLGEKANTLNVLEGKATMDAIRAQIDQMKEAENNLLMQRQAATERSQSLFFMTLILTTALSSIVVTYAFVQMRRNQSRAADELAVQTREAWIREHVADVSRIVAGDQPFTTVTHEVLTFLSARLGVSAAKLFVREHNAFRLAGAVGVEHKTDESSEFVSESSLLTESAARGDFLVVENVPGDYWKFSSSLGESIPKSLAFAPLKFQGQTIGVIEFAAFEVLDERTRDLFVRLGETIGVGLNAALSRERLQALLSETQQQAEELQSQQEELRVNNEELEQQARALESQQEALASKNKDLEQVQADLEKKASDLERSSQYKSEFLAKMSHELRTPLNGLLILSTLLIENKEKNLTEQQKNFARSIQSAGNDLLTLINDILDLAKVEAKKLAIRKEFFTLGSLFQAKRQTFLPQMAAKNLEYITDLPEDLKSVKIYTDRQRLDQILRNFLSNAVKFTDKGAVTMSAKVDPLRKWVDISVTDTGIGVAKDKKELIFEAFEQADSSTSRTYGGTGLGLTISRELAQLLGGEIFMTSEEGKGSTFTLRMPLGDEQSVAKTDNPEPAATSASSMSHGREAYEPAPQRQQIDTKRQVQIPPIPEGEKTILIVEDDDAFRSSVVEVTKSYGFAPIEAADGETALAILDAHAPDAILLDIKLPGISGLGILEMIKTMPNRRHIPVHMISALEYQQSALRMGALGYLTKPVTLDKVRSALGRIESLLSEKVRRVLLIEDDERQNRAVAELVSGEDVVVSSVRTGAQAVETLKKQPFDCIILDLSLPDISGFDLLEQLNELAISLPPIVIYTGKDLTQEEESYLRRFSESIIIKGARSPERLLDEVNLFLHRVESLLPHEKQEMLSTLRSQDQSFENRTVLLVDDDVRNLFALTSVLETRGLKVRFAKDGIAALEELEKHDDIELVLMDIMMPRMDGLEATKRIRSNNNDRIRKLPVIALTAKAMKDDHEKCIAAGATDYLPKPINLDNLMTVLKVWLSPKHMFA
jgi:CheY-like chemotaxis protein/CHASE3 domain sensor protein